MFNQPESFSVWKYKFTAGKVIYPLKFDEKFMLNGKMTHFQQLPFVQDGDEDSEGFRWMRDKRNGKSVYWCWDKIPTFDYEDRLFANYSDFYFFRDKLSISAINLCYGYQLGLARIYKNVQADNDAAAELIRKIIDKDKPPQHSRMLK